MLYASTANVVLAKSNTGTFMQTYSSYVAYHMAACSYPICLILLPDNCGNTLVQKHHTYTGAVALLLETTVPDKIESHCLKLLCLGSLPMTIV